MYSIRGGDSGLRAGTCTVCNTSRGWDHRVRVLPELGLTLVVTAKDAGRGRFRTARAAGPSHAVTPGAAVF